MDACLHCRPSLGTGVIKRICNPAKGGSVGTKSPSLTSVTISTGEQHASQHGDMGPLRSAGTMTSPQHTVVSDLSANLKKVDIQRVWSDFFFFPWSVRETQIAKFGSLWLLLAKALTHCEYRPGSFYCCWSGRWWGRKWRRNRPFQSRRSRRRSSLPASHSFCQPECFYRYLQSRGSEFEKDETLLQCLCEKGLEEGVIRPSSQSHQPKSCGHTVAPKDLTLFSFFWDSILVTQFSIISFY